MGGKPRPPRLRVTFTEPEAKEIYEQLAKTWTGYGATRDLLGKLSDFLDRQAKENQLPLPGIEQ